MPSNIPSIRSLMDDPLYRAYMKRVPPAHNANRAGSGNPWQIWVETSDHKWRTGTFPTYQRVWPVFLENFRDRSSVHDVSIVSRRVFYAPPGEWYRVKVRRDRPTPSGETHRIENRWRQTFTWPEVDLHWCGRCRRPSYWMPLFNTHHALRKMPAITDEDNFRCILCGIRWIATPPIDLMEKGPVNG